MSAATISHRAGDASQRRGAPPPPAALVRRHPAIRVLRDHYLHFVAVWARAAAACSPRAPRGVAPTTSSRVSPTPMGEVQWRQRRGPVARGLGGVHVEDQLARRRARARRVDRPHASPISCRRRIDRETSGRTVQRQRHVAQSLGGSGFEQIAGRHACRGRLPSECEDRSFGKVRTDDLSLANRSGDAGLGREHCLRARPVDSIGEAGIIRQIAQQAFRVRYVAVDVAV